MVRMVIKVFAQFSVIIQVMFVQHVARKYELAILREFVILSVR